MVGAGMSLGRRSLPSRQSAVGSVGSIGESRLICLDVNNLGIASDISLVGGFVAEDVVSLEKSSLLILAAVDEIGIVESKLNRTVHNVIRGLNAKHE
jgi:hypothetical protein